MLVLGVESSCDETALALVDESGVLASVMSTQVDVHALFGGVVPELASREHARLIGPLCDELWRRAFLSKPSLFAPLGFAPLGLAERVLGHNSPSRAAANTWPNTFADTCPDSFTDTLTDTLQAVPPALFSADLLDNAWQRVDRIAVARGPGLLGSLLVGVAFAKALCLGRGIPLVGVNHLHAHLLVAGLPGQGDQKLEFPALGVLVSGGHTHLYRMDSPSSLTALGRTMDDAAGEACDKFAKMAGLPYPGGALLDALGKRGTATPSLFPRPYIHNDNLDFSFSGLKTAGSQWLQQHPDVRFPAGATPARDRLNEAPQALCDVAASYLLAVADTLSIKARRAMTLFQPRCIVVAGGVAANSVVRHVFGVLAAEKGIPLLVPSLPLCTDNGVMIAWAGLLLAQAGFYHDLDMPAIARGRPIPDDHCCLPSGPDAAKF